MIDQANKMGLVKTFNKNQQNYFKNLEDELMKILGEFKVEESEAIKDGLEITPADLSINSEPPEEDVYMQQVGEN